MDLPIQVVDIDLICRVCMQTAEEMFWIFEELRSSEAEGNESVAEMISECTKYRVERYDQLPHLICGACVKQVRQAYRFKKECEQNYRSMIDLLGCTFDVKKETNSAEEKCDVVEVAIQTEDSALYPCDRCEEKYYTFDSLRVHRRVFHKVNAIICHYCAKTFYRLQSLKTHMQNCHNAYDDAGLETNSDEDEDKQITSTLAISGGSVGSTEDADEHVYLSSTTAKATTTTITTAAIRNQEKVIHVKREETILTSKTDLSIIEDISEFISEDDTEEGEERLAIGSVGDSFIEDRSGEEEYIDQEYKDEDEDEGHTSSATSGEELNKIRRKRKLALNADEKRKRGRPRKDKPNQVHPHKCDLCDKSFEHEVNLQRHRYHHNEVKQQRTCENCGKYFANENMLQSHIKKVHGTPSVIKCDECSEEFTLVKKYQRHKEKEHGAKFHNCTFCKKNFRSKMYLIRHMEKHNQKQYICRECQQGFTTKDELHEHIKAERHDKTMLCPECGLRCKTSHELTAHRRSHNGEKPYKCKFCSKAFARMDALGMHEKYHIDVKSHFCGICGKGFHRAYNLRVHERVHTGEKPYQCPHCPQAFKQGNDLKAHIRRHTGERFRCEFCNAGFLQFYQLRQHKLNEHGIKEEAPTQRVAKFVSPEEQEQQITKQKELTVEKPEETNVGTEEQQASDVLISIVWD